MSPSPIATEIKYHRYCLRCGRKLKTEKAKLRGYGDVCYEKSRTERIQRKLF